MRRVVRLDFDRAATPSRAERPTSNAAGRVLRRPGATVIVKLVTRHVLCDRTRSQMIVLFRATCTFLRPERNVREDGAVEQVENAAWGDPSG